MPDLTAITVTASTRDALRQLADREGRTIEDQLMEMIRRERRRVIGRELSTAALSPGEVAFLSASAADVAAASAEA